MLTVQVSLKKAEKVRKFLLDNNLYNKKFKAKKQGNKIYFPIKENKGLKKKFSHIEFKEIELEEARQKITYKDLLNDIDNLEMLPSSYDVIGEIIIIEVPKELKKVEKKIGQALLKTHKNVKTVLKKADIHSGEFRTQKLDLLAGADTRETIYKENNVRLKLDVEKVYFSPRLSTERKRIFQKVKKGEKVLVMFSGCAPYPITISRNTKVSEIVGIEKHPIAHTYAKENIKLNKIKNIKLIKGDVRKEVPKLKSKFDRIIMPLPKDAETFLDLITNVIKKQTYVHVYVFAHDEKEAAQIIKKESEKINLSHKIIEPVVCGQYSPCLYRFCVDMKVHAH